MRFFAFLVVLIFFNANCFGLQDGLKRKGAPAVCNETTNIPVTRRVPDIQTSQENDCDYGPQLRFNYKTETLSILQTVETCCPGYEQIDKDICMPKCDSDCINADCVLPQVCECRPGFQRSSHNVSVCDPICDPPCNNGKCVNVNQCQCNEGYALPDDSNYDCQPICEQNCIHGQCVKPNECKCNLGYQKVDRYTCKPQCIQSCENGVCKRPNYCECINDRYEYDNYTGNCVATKCLGCYGDCVAPGLCRCSLDEDLNPYEWRYDWPRGYQDCEPDCPESCKSSNGYCREKNVCSCQRGHKLKQPERNRCLPVCNGGCNNGTCVAPNKCVCNKDFAKDSNGVCKTECVKCGSAKCIPPDYTCYCEIGFVFDTKSKSCKPECEMCMDEECNYQPFCCMKGFERLKNGTCVRSCPNECMFGTCDYDRLECKCDYGYSGAQCNDTSEYCAVYFDKRPVDSLRSRWIQSDDYYTFTGKTCRRECAAKVELYSYLCGNCDPKLCPGQIICFLRTDLNCNNEQISATTTAAPIIAKKSNEILDFIIQYKQYFLMGIGGTIGVILLTCVLKCKRKQRQSTSLSHRPLTVDF